MSGVDNGWHDKMQRDTAAAERRVAIAKLYRDGLTYREIAARTGISTRIISIEINEMLREWRESYSETIEVYALRELSIINDVQAKAYEEFERSKRSSEIIKEEEDADSGKRKAKTTTKAKGHAGGYAYLNIILECVEKRMRLLGINTAERFELTTGREIIEVECNTREDVMRVEELERELASMKVLAISGGEDETEADGISDQ